jgi:hypothetical protein
MPLTIRQTRRQASLLADRDAANELYDRACDLLASGQALRAATERDRNQAAVAATLGCIESAMREISAGCLQLSASADRLIENGQSARGAELHVARVRLGREFQDVVNAISQAADQCSLTRAAAGPLLAELTAR